MVNTDFMVQTTYLYTQQNTVYCMTMPVYAASELGGLSESVIEKCPRHVASQDMSHPRADFGLYLAVYRLAEVFKHIKYGPK